MSRKLKVVYTIPMFSQKCTGMYARFHDVIHTLQRMEDPPWEYTIVPLRRYYGKPSPNVLFQDGSVPFRLLNYLRNVAKDSRDADLIHVVQGDFPYSLLVPLIVNRDIPIIAGPNVIRVGISPEWVIHTQGEFQSHCQELAIRLGLSIHHWNRLVFHRKSPFSAHYRHILVFKGFLPLAIDLGGMDSKKLEVLPSGVRTDIFHPSGKSISYATDFAILYVGDARRAYLKGFDIFVTSLKRLKESEVQFHAYVVGRTDTKIKQMVVQNELEYEIDLVGIIPRAHLAAYYRGADVYVCPSRYEADSTTATEALACGTPVVGTDIPGIPKTLAFQPGNAEDLARKLIEVRKGKKGYKLQAREEAHKWSIRVVIDKLQEIYQLAAHK